MSQYNYSWKLCLLFSKKKNSKARGHLLFSNYSQNNLPKPTHKHHKIRSCLCTPHWIKISDMQDRARFSTHFIHKFCMKYYPFLCLYYVKEIWENVTYWKTEHVGNLIVGPLNYIIYMYYSIIIRSVISNHCKYY